MQGDILCTTDSVPLTTIVIKKGTMLDLKRIKEYNQMQYVVLDLNTGLDKPSM